MSWLSESVEILVARELLKENGEPEVHDAVVVGSGYGGAVSALRLAQRGVRVLVLERGKEYLPGDFPNGVGDAFGHVRLERDGSDSIGGYESGLYDVRWGDGIGALVGNALGGTSQINASVVLAPDPRVFAKLRGGKPAWPSQLVVSSGGEMEPALAAAYDRAREMLAPETFEDDSTLHPLRNEQRTVAVRPLKRVRLRELSQAIAGKAQGQVKVSFEPVDITVNLGENTIPGPAAIDPCIGCGECVSGCNWRAKKTLTRTYLPAARAAGAQMFTGVTVLTVDRTGDHWVVRFVRTETRKMHRDEIDVPVHELHARHVVLSAGTFGSTEILLRSNKKTSLTVSQCLGQRLSTNGDSLAFGYMLKGRVNGIGVGSAAVRPAGYAVGPTITAMIRVDDPADVTQSMLIQDGAIPNAISGLFQEMIAMSATLAQLDSHGYRDLPPAGTPAEKANDWAVLQARARANTLTLLGIGHDPSAGSLKFDPVADRLRLAYPTDQSKPVAKLHAGYMKAVADLGAIYIPNPVLDPLPERVAGMLSGPEMDNGTFTVHPLGGCCMADSGASGVVNHLGQVFAGKGDQVHEGLYVLDGSIIPTSLGANPLFTITALAERAMEQLAVRFPTTPADESARTDAALGNEPRTAAPDLNPHAGEVNVHFTEAMRARPGGLRWREQDCDAHLLLHMPVDDLNLFGTDGRHLIVIPNQLQAQRRDKEQLEPHLSIDSRDQQASTPAEKVRVRLLVESGWVSILPVPPRRRLGWDFAWLRTALTWWIERGFDEVMQMMPWMERQPDASDAGVVDRILGFVKLCRHASENRVMEYHLRLRDETPSDGDSTRCYTLEGRKEVGYAASWSALGRYILGVTRPLDRANVWKAFGLLHVRIRDEDDIEVGMGVLELDMLDMTRMHAPQLGLQRDTPNALLALAGYPLWFARLLVKTRLWDFRLPDYPTHIPCELIPRSDPRWPVIPVPDTEDAEKEKREQQEANGQPAPVPEPLWPDFPDLRIHDGGASLRRVPACPSEEVRVQRSKGLPAEVTLKLTRYRQPELTRVKTEQGPTQFKVLLMLNGFAQSTLGFVPQEHVRKPGQPDDEPGLAEFFYEQGYDIWLFDYRTSSILETSKLPCSMDEIAEYDIPTAVDRVRDQLAEESGVAAADIRIFAFAHCVGAASLAMSLLGGHLRDRLAGVTFSQMQAFLVGSRTAQMRLRVGGILRDTLGIEYLRLSAAERKPTVLESMLDRLFASLPVDPGEYCPNEHNRVTPRPAICTCKRMSGTISRLLKHDRIKAETHDKLPVYFGRANTSLLVHGGRCVDNERLVNADGQNVYVTDANIRDHLNLPVAILHGEHNALFDVESAERTHDQFRRVHPQLEAAGVCTKIIARGFGHFDCTIGFGECMHTQILTPLRDFYRRAWNFHSAAALPPDPRELRSLAKAPLSGPLVGWTRHEERDGKLWRLVRLWIEVDERESLGADWVVTYCTEGGIASPPVAPGVQLWPVIRVPLNGDNVDRLGPETRTDTPPYIAIGLADLEFEVTAESTRDLRVYMFSIHSALFRRRTEVPQRQTVQDGKTPGIADPLSPEELAHAAQDGTLPQLLSFAQDFWSASKDLQPPAHTGSDGRRIASAGAMPPEKAQTLWNGLMMLQREEHQLAQRADPRTLSRTRRRLALPLAHHRGIAVLKPQTIRAPREPAGVAFVAASCRHPGLAFEDRRSDASLERITQHLARTPARPAFMLMLGDQIYADATAGLMDSPSAVEKVVMSHQRAFGTPGFIDLTSSLPTYMVIDDHEIGDGWSRDLLNLSKEGQCTVRALRKHAEARHLLVTAQAAFSAYQWAHSPRNGNVDANGMAHVKAPGFNYHFDEGGCPFFVLDTRTQRTRFSSPPQVCDPAQLVELDRWFAQFDPGDKRPKFVVSGSVFAPGLRMAVLPEPGVSDLSCDTWQMAQGQRAQVLSSIATRRIRNVVFISGDYHCAATATLEFDDVLRAYAVVTPPLYAQLPAANAKRWQIMRKESLTLANGGPTVTIEAKTSDGDGFAEIRALPLPDGRWQLEVGLHQIDSADKSVEPGERPRTFLLD